MIYKPNHNTMGFTVQAGTPMTVTEDGAPVRNPETAAAPERSGHA